MGYTSQKLADLKHVSVASANIMLAKIYMDSVKGSGSAIDPHLFDAALLSAIVKYGSVFKADSRGRVIHAAKIFTSRIVIVNAAKSSEPIIIQGEGESFLAAHKRIMQIRDQFVAHDDRIVGNTECFAAFDDQLNCEHVIALTERSGIFSVLKADVNMLAMCIDATFTWLKVEKDRQCQLVNDEINSLKLRTREKFPTPRFGRFRGLPDADVRKSEHPHWEFDWTTGTKKQAGEA
jgi:hypothetical protein